MSKKEHYQEKIDRYLKQIDEVIAKGPYKADWASLTGMEVPDWFRRAKFGIFIHWGCTACPPSAMNGIPERCMSRELQNISTI